MTECKHDGTPLEGETSAYTSGKTTCCEVFYKATEYGPLCRCCGRVVVGDAQPA